MIRSPVSMFPFVALAVAGWLTIPHEVSSAEPVMKTWRVVESFTAPEAHQAAAADERFIYAITNDRVARYDRQSQQLVGTSRGAAQHLNSGFLWQGHLYCAHSNYPRVPEQSTLMRLDLDTLELSPFKEWGNYGGSLTWAVYHDEAWWCNFARYGDQNAETFLIRCNNQWQETGRWTYPAEVLDALGRYSLSGGLWRDNRLYVTGHDDRFVFVLRLPKTGRVLSLIERQAIPFTGQGIAADPRTGGLVGIDRARRLVLVAVPSTP